MQMKKIIKIGGSIYVSLPKKDCDLFGWKAGENVIVDITKTNIKITKHQVENL